MTRQDSQWSGPEESHSPTHPAPVHHPATMEASIPDWKWDFLADMVSQGWEMLPPDWELWDHYQEIPLPERDWVPYSYPAPEDRPLGEDSAEVQPLHRPEETRPERRYHLPVAGGQEEEPPSRPRGVEVHQQQALPLDLSG